MATRTEIIMGLKASAERQKFGREGERAAFHAGFMLGKMSIDKGHKYHHGGRCFHAYNKGRKWGDAIKREMQRDFIIKRIMGVVV